MLSFIKISNYALIERAELEFGPGFNVVTGESGAGKSILMGAVELLLGGRVDRSVVRTGADRCEVTGCFDVPPHLVKVIAGLLMEAGIPFDPAQPELQLRRVIGASSVRNFINDTPVSARLLGSIGEQLYQSKVYFDLTSLYAWTVAIVLVSVLFEKAVLLAVRLLYGRLERL